MIDRLKVFSIANYLGNPFQAFKTSLHVLKVLSKKNILFVRFVQNTYVLGIRIQRAYHIGIFLNYELKPCIKIGVGPWNFDGPISATNWSWEDFSTTAPTYFFMENPFLNVLGALGHSIDRFGLVKVITWPSVEMRINENQWNINEKQWKINENQ